MRLEVEGADELARALGALVPAERLPETRAGLTAGAELLAAVAKARASGFSSRAAAALSVERGEEPAVVAGGLRWYGWADFGSRTPVRGQPRSVGPWAGSGKGPLRGRFLYPAADVTDAPRAETLERSLVVAFKRVGF